MIVTPIGKNILIKLNQIKDGAFDTSSKKAIQEYGEIIAIGDEVIKLKVGDKIFFKGWQTDIITKDGEEFVFVIEGSEGLKATYK